jgi:hypothetical protein
MHADLKPKDHGFGSKSCPFSENQRPIAFDLKPKKTSGRE